MSSPSITWSADVQTLGRTDAPTSRPSLAVYKQQLWAIYLGPQSDPDPRLCYVYYQTADATELPLVWSDPQPILNSSEKSRLKMFPTSQIGLRVVDFNGTGNPTLVMWTTFPSGNDSWGEVFLLNNFTNSWLQYALPWVGDFRIIDGCLGVTNQGTSGEGIAFYTVYSPDNTNTNLVVIYNVFDYDNRDEPGNWKPWLPTVQWKIGAQTPGYNMMSVLDWKPETQMVLGYYAKGVVKTFDLYEHDAGDPFTLIGKFTIDATGQQDAARNGAQCSQNPNKPDWLSDLTYLAFAGPPSRSGGDGPVKVSIHTDQWYYSSQVLNETTAVCPAIAAFKEAVFCAWLSSEDPSQILLARGNLNPTPEDRTFKNSSDYK